MELLASLNQVYDFAEAFVALTSADSKKAQVSAAMSRKATDALSKKHAKQIALFWEEANRDALKLTVLVMQNNPHKTKAQILKRPDVQAVLREPFLEAAAKSETLLRAAWEEAETLAVKHTKAEVKLLGSDWKGYEVDVSLRDALVGDLHRNAEAMRARYIEAMKGSPEDAEKRLKVVASDSTRRARYSLSQAVWGVATQVRDAACALAGLNKMWVAVNGGKDPASCQHCKDLHGYIVGPNEHFPIAAALRAYLDSLLGPPRHPNCRCVIVLTKLKKSKKP